MADLSFSCLRSGCGFRTTSIQALVEHDAFAHPHPGGDPIATARARVQQLCGQVGGHVPSMKDRSKCSVCHAPLAKSQALRHACHVRGCDYSSLDPEDLELHDVVAHGLKEVTPVVPDLLSRRVVWSICGSRGGHVPNPINPAACLACGARLEVLRG